MNKIWTVLFVLFFANVKVLASSGCEYLNVTIENKTNRDCKLIDFTANTGYILGNKPAKVIHPGETSRPIKLKQELFTGIGFSTTYQCGKKLIEIISNQNYCLLSAGNVYGEVETFNSLHTIYKPINGSYSDSQNGQLDWTIFG
jgi:hypothetical protein